MFENFMAFDDCPIAKTDYQDDAIYLVIFNDDGYKEAIDWLDNDSETRKISSKESSYYVYDDNGFYKPLYGVDNIPEQLINCFNKHHNTENTNISSTPELYTVKLHLSDGTIIKPNYQSDNMLDFASIIEQLLTDELFNGQVEKIVID